MPAFTAPPASGIDHTLATALTLASERLARAGVPDPDVDAALLAGFVLGLGRGEVQAAALRGDLLDDESAARFTDAVTRRCTREPLQHITGEAPFRHLVLSVGPGVFVPRPETEIAAQVAIDALWADASPVPLAVDLGTGSGALALAMATEVPHARVFAAERSVDAFLWAKQNATRVGATNVTIARIDIAHAFPDLDGTVSVVVSNPPYVPDAAIPRDPEVQRFDPPEALYGGPDGLDVVREVSTTALRLLRPGGTVAIEHGEWQGEAVRMLLTESGWRAAATHPDLTLRDRVTTALRP